MNARRVFKSTAILLAMVVIATGACGSERPEAADKQHPYLVYVGSYTHGDSQGIYVFQFDPATGELTSPTLAAATENPSFFAVHRNGRFLYAVNETTNYDDQESGSVAAFAIDKDTGQLSLLNQVSSQGGTPCHLSLDETGRSLVVANYDGGNVAVFPVGGDGRLGEASAVVQHEGSSANHTAHPHAAVLSPDNRLVFVADLGLDELLAYNLDPEAGALAQHEPAVTKVDPGAGPRHFTFHPDGGFAFVINELLSTITAFAYDDDPGALTPLQTVSTLPEGFSGRNDTAEIEVHASGKFLYGSNRGHDSIVVFDIDSATGKLTPVQHQSTQGKTPRNFAIDPTGAYLFAANQDSDNIVVFQIDQETGRLAQTGKVVQSPMPISIIFVER